jgi:hypothetical protein
MVLDKNDFSQNGLIFFHINLTKFVLIKMITQLIGMSKINFFLKNNDSNILIELQMCQKCWPKLAISMLNFLFLFWVIIDKSLNVQ